MAPFGDRRDEELSLDCSLPSGRTGDGMSRWTDGWLIEDEMMEGQRCEGVSRR